MAAGCILLNMGAPNQNDLARQELVIAALFRMQARRGAAHGTDVDEQGAGTGAEQRLYQLIRQPKPIADQQFQIEYLNSGVEAFAFTFG